MSQPDLYAAASQVIPVLFLAILFELRFIAPFLRLLMDNEIKLGLYHAAERKRPENAKRYLLETRLFNMSATHLNLKNHRTKWAPYMFYLHTAQLIERSEWAAEVRHYERRRRLIFLGIYLPISVGAVSLIASFVALSYDEPPTIIAAFVVPGVVGLILLFCAMFVGIVKAQCAAAKKAGWEVLNLVVEPPKSAQPEKYVAVRQEEANRQALLRDFLK
jgi:hypothetical protein